MLELMLFNLALIAVIVVALVILRKKVKSEKGKKVALVAASLLTIVCHYSSLVFHLLRDGTAMDFLSSNPNLILPIYPCNVVMWACLIFGLIKNKNAHASRFFADYIFWFGILSALIGMFVNIDFIRTPSFADFDVTKGIVAHAFMLLNILMLPIFGFIKIDLPKNFLHIVLSMVMMFLIGCYCNLVFEVIASKEAAVSVNSMFLLASPCAGMEHIRYPLICLMAAVLYFIVFSIGELFAYPKGRRWISRYFKRKTS